MNTTTTQQSWKHYYTNELKKLATIVRDLGFVLDDEQKHLIGERYLMRAVTTESGKKMVLTGRRTADDKKVIIKIASDPQGKRELEGERARRTQLYDMKFAYNVFFSPKELLVTEHDGYLISVQSFIEQEMTFLERPLREQFTLALSSFQAQEGAHATTYEHHRGIRKYFNHKCAHDYRGDVRTFTENIIAILPHDTTRAALLTRAREFIESHEETIEQYGDFLTHTDFVPHNIRVTNGKIYLLDHSSIRFGNKYEGWARFINFMVLYNPPLAEALLAYVRLNRTHEEYLSLRLMRVYRLCEITWYYTQTLERSEGDLKELNRARVTFWLEVLASVLDDRPLGETIRENYTALRDRLRSTEEKKRQVDLH